jgi:hypothetical protein
MSIRAKLLKEAARLELPRQSSAGEIITATQIARLPGSVQRYFRFMRVAGRSQDWSFRAGLTGRFRVKPGQSWKRCEAWQYNNRLALARILFIGIQFAGLLPVIARDTYVRNAGQLLVRVLDRFTIADGRGEEYDIGELVTYLNDAVLIAPSMLLVPEVARAEADLCSFDVSLTAKNCQVAARVTIDENGAPTDFSTFDRFWFDPEHPNKPLRTRWTTPISGWQLINGRPEPTSARTVWHLSSGPFIYGEFSPIPGSLAFNVPAG